ncbi:MAG: VWA domain-containing protein [Planctomycetota bacterium]|nr:VWA domain-containing protein [Planctomycetota bacterium]
MIASLAFLGEGLGFHPGSAWWLLLLPLALLAWLPSWGRRRARLAHSRAALIAEGGGTWVTRLRWLPSTLRMLAIALLVVCIARPIKANERSRVFVEGVAIQSVIDRSSSMQAQDFEFEGGMVDRLSAVKKVLREFVDGDDELEGRPDDLIGLISFARYADTASPLTLDHAHVLQSLDGVGFAGGDEDGTAIGDAIALAVERLRELDDRSESESRRIKSRVIVLLTDGENNQGDLDPDTAAEIAQAFGVKIYTIGVGSHGTVLMNVRGLLGRSRRVPVPVSIDEETLTRIAERTGGRYFRATDTDSLREIYAAIDKLEKTTTEQRRYRLYRDLAVSPLRLGPIQVPPLLLLVVLLLGLELALTNTRFRRLP